MPYIFVVVQCDFYPDTTRNKLITILQIITLKHHLEVIRMHFAVIHTSIILSFHVNLSAVNHGKFPGIF